MLRDGAIMGEMVPGVDDVLAAPVGVALLDRLEHAQRPLFRPFDALPDSDPAAVERAIIDVGTMSVGYLLALALDAADSLAGPWTGGASGSLSVAYQLAATRRSLADALWQRFGHVFVGPLQPDSQEYWIGPPPPEVAIEPAFTDFSRVYGNGEFTSSGIWTVSTPPPEVHDYLVAAWEMDRGPVSRWRLPVNDGVRVWNIDHPADWERLVETFPKVATKPHAGWELPGPNQHSTDVAGLASLSNQHAVRTTCARHVLPDWAAVAREYDGVHLSWAGFLTVEGFVSDLPDGGVTMLRYWSSERTLWCRDLFDSPEPLGAPALSGSVGGLFGIDVAHDNEARAESDRAEISVRLNRS